MATLETVAKELQEQKGAIRDVASEINQLNSNLLGMFSGESGDQLERERERIRQQRAQGQSSEAIRPPSSQQNQNRGGLNLGGFGIGAALAGLGAAGVGLGGFFLGLAGSEAIIENLGGGDNLGKLLGNIGEGLESFSNRDLASIAALVGTGAAAGALFAIIPGVGAIAGLGAVTGMSLIGLGIGGFFAGFAASGAASEFISGSNDGSNLVPVAENVAKAIGFFADPTTASLTAGLLAVGGLFGAVGAATGPLGALAVGGGVIGLGLIGFGLGAFFSGFAAAEGAMDLVGIDGDGSRFVKIAENVAASIKPFGDLDGDRILKSGAAIGAVGVGLGTFFGAQGLGVLAGLGQGALELIERGVNFLIGVVTGQDGTVNFAKSPIERIVEGLKPLDDLSDEFTGKLNSFSGALNTFFDAFSNIANLDSSRIGGNLGKSLEGLGGILDALPYILDGGTWTGNKFGLGDNINFGDGLNGLSAQNIAELTSGLDRLNAALGMDIFSTTGTGGMTPAPSSAELNAMLTEGRERLLAPGQGVGSVVAIGGGNVTDQSQTNINQSIVGTPTSALDSNSVPGSMQ